MSEQEQMNIYGNEFYRNAEATIEHPDELIQLRTQLADARRIISELEAAQGIAGIELKRLRECNKALRQHVKALAAKLKANGVRA